MTNFDSTTTVPAVASTKASPSSRYRHTSLSPGQHRHQRSHSHSQQGRQGVRDLLGRRQQSSMSPFFALSRKRKINNNSSNNNAHLAKEALKAAIESKDLKLPLSFGDHHYHDPVELQQRKASALLGIRKLMQAQRRKDDDEKSSLLKFLGQTSTPLTSKQSRSRSQRHQDQDELASTIPQAEEDHHHLTHVPPFRSISSSSKSKRPKRTPAQQQEARKAHQMLKGVNRHHRTTALQQVAHQALAKQAARQAMKFELLKKQQKLHEKSLPPTPTPPRPNPDKLLLMKQAVKAALLRSHSHDNFSTVAQQLLTSATRKNWRKQSAIALQAAARGHLVRRRSASDGAFSAPAAVSAIAVAPLQ